MEIVDMRNERFRAIVTGAGGFLGSALCKTLSAQDAEIVAVVRNSETANDTLSSLPHTRIVSCGMESYTHLAQTLRDFDADVCYHFAWEGSTGAARQDPGIQLRNVAHTCDLVRACAEMRCRRFVYAGSIMEYELEACTRAGLQPPASALYSAAKMSAGYMAGVLAASYGTDYIRTIISNVYGPGEKNPRLIHSSLRSMLAGEACAFSPGEQMYDFVYIDDAAAMFAALGTDGRPNGLYYIGSGAPRRLKAFLTEMRDVAAPEMPSGLGKKNAPACSLQYNEFDLHAVERDTGITAQVSFAEGIRRTAEWIRENPQ